MLIVSSRQQWDNEIKLREKNEMFAEIYIKTERFQLCSVASWINLLQFLFVWRNYRNNIRDKVDT